MLALTKLKERRVYFSAT